MTEQHVDAGAVASDDEHGPRRTLRRGLVAGAVGAAAAVMLDRGSPANAADPNDVVRGVDNITTATTTITNTTPTSGVGLRARCEDANNGTGLEGYGSAYGVIGYGGFYAGVYGRNTSNVGVNGYSLGNSSQSIGVSGASESATGAGVVGRCRGIGVVGRADYLNEHPSTPVGVYGAAPVADGMGGVFTGSRAPLRLLPAAFAGAPAAGAHEVGEVVVDSAGKVFVCTTSGTPGLWNELGAAVTPATPRPTLQLLPTPERFVDTRLALGGVQGVVPAGTTNTFSLTGRLGQAANPQLQIPDGATAIVGNLTVIGAPGTPGAYLTMWPGGDMPTVSNINYGPNSVGDAIANSFTVGLADTGDGHRGVKLFNFGQCDYIIDVTGYYVLA